MYPKKYRLLINDFSAPRIFTKLLKVPTSVLRRLMIRIMIYIDNLLILRKHYERNIYDKGLRDLPIATSRLFDKSEEVCVRSCTRNRVIRIDCEFPNYDSAITSGKDRKVKDQNLRLYKASEVSLLDLTKIIGTLSSTIQVVLPARLQFRFLQQQQILSLKKYSFTSLCEM